MEEKSSDSQHCKLIVILSGGTVLILSKYCSIVKSRSGGRSTPSFSQRYLFFFFMQSVIDVGTCWLIAFCSLWDVWPTYRLS